MIFSSGFERISANAEFGFGNLKIPDQEGESKRLSKNYFGDVVNSRNKKFGVGESNPRRYSAKVESEGNYAPGMSGFKGSSTNKTSKIEFISGLGRYIGWRKKY